MKPLLPWLLRVFFPAEHRRREAHKAKMEQLDFWQSECLRIGRQIHCARSLADVTHVRRQYDVAAKRFNLELAKRFNLELTRK